MAESPRAQRAARHHQGQEVDTAGVSEFPPRQVDTAGNNPAHSPPLFACLQGTVSTLTTGNTVRTALNHDEDVDFMGGGGGGFDDKDVAEERNDNEEVLPPLPPLKSIFDCGYVNQMPTGWECMWCGKSFVGKHSTRALHHVLKLKKNDVGVCSAAIPDLYLKRYEALFQYLSQRSAARKRSHEEKHDAVAVSRV